MKKLKLALLLTVSLSSAAHSQSITIENDSSETVPITTGVDPNPNFNITAGLWFSSTRNGLFSGQDYQVNGEDSFAEVEWLFQPQDNIEYEVFVISPAFDNFTTVANYSVIHSAGTTTVQLNQQLNDGIPVSLGTFREPTAVRLNNQGRDGFVIADAIQFVSVTDSDQDGLSDEDEINTFFSDPNNAFSLDPTGRLNDALFDSDGDGISNINELTLGFDPLDPNSSPPISTEESTFNTNVTINGAVLLTPQLVEPFLCEAETRGAIYYDDFLDGPLICNGLEWSEFRGAAGLDGRDGVDGINGTNGIDGVDGQDGAQGPQGEQGIQGEQGPQGEQGIQGPAGIDGIDGQDGAPGISRGTLSEQLGAGTFDSIFQSFTANLAGTQGSIIVNNGDPIRSRTDGVPELCNTLTTIIEFEGPGIITELSLSEPLDEFRVNLDATTFIDFFVFSSGPPTGQPHECSLINHSTKTCS